MIQLHFPSYAQANGEDASSPVDLGFEFFKQTYVNLKLQMTSDPL